MGERDRGRREGRGRSDPRRDPRGLEEVEVDGVAHWFDPSLPRRTTARRAAYLLPVYDEAVLTCPAVNFPAAQGHPAGGAVDAFWEPVVVDEINAGMWRRTVGKEAVTVETRLATGLDHEQRSLVRSAAQRLADFLERDLDYRDVGPSSRRRWAPTRSPASGERVAGRARP